MKAMRPSDNKPKVLYITQGHNPYRDAFFEQIGTKCDLTVVFESDRNPNRPSSWYEDIRPDNYREVYLPEKKGSIVSKTLLDICARGWDLIVVGCVNNKHQICSILYMRLRRIPYIINLDGPLFQSGTSLKRRMRRRVLKGADAYLVAGKTSVDSVRRELGESIRISPYAFTSLTKGRLAECASIQYERDENLILCVGQFRPYKGIDVLLDAFAGLRRGELRLRVIGAGGQDAELKDAIRARGLEADVEVVPFLTPDELVREYARAGLFVLPSRQECWGLVVNEAAACGCPIVSTWGSGAAVEFLAQDYSKLLAIPSDAASLRNSLEYYLAFDEYEKEIYSNYLIDKAQNYSIEAEVAEHLSLFDELMQEKLAD